MHRRVHLKAFWVTQTRMLSQMILLAIPGRFAHSPLLISNSVILGNSGHIAREIYCDLEVHIL